MTNALAILTLAAALIMPAAAQDLTLTITVPAAVVAEVQAELEARRGPQIEGQTRPPAMTVREYFQARIQGALRPILGQVKTGEIARLRDELQAKEEQLRQAERRAVQVQ